MLDFRFLINSVYNIALPYNQSTATKQKHCFYTLGITKSACTNVVTSVLILTVQTTHRGASTLIRDQKPTIKNRKQ